MIAANAKVREFSGKVIRRDADDYGLVVLDDVAPQEPEIGFFTHDVVFHPKVSKVCRVGHKVHGTAVKFGSSYKILRIEPV